MNVIVNKRVIVAALGLCLTFLMTGCQSLFITHQTTVQSQWTNWDDVNIAFKHIVPNHTTVQDLQVMGFDPNTTPNIKIMPYVDMVPVFMPNPNIRLGDLPIGVRLYFESKDNNGAYLVELENVKEKRHGNLVLDMFGFKRLTHQSGWRFKGLILIKNDTVVYTLSSGEPDISQDDNKIRPLGPFQELDACAGSLIGMCH
jgi:hypothetical protein